MNNATSGVKTMVGFTVGLVALAIGSVMGIAVLTGFKDSDTLSAQGNTTVDAFITGIAVFGTFATVLALTLIGKIVLKLIQEN